MLEMSAVKLYRWPVYIINPGDESKIILLYYPTEAPPQII